MKIKRHVRLDEIQFHKLMVSITEAVNNAIVHGNKSDPDKKVIVKCDVLPGWLVIEVEDQGGGFDPTHVGSPLKKKNLLKEDGRGIFLMKTLMDKVEFDISETGVHVFLWLDLSKT
jgi:serine/threonine-protein kinase RsbW